MTYLFIVLGFLFLGFVFHIGSAVALAFKKIVLTVISVILAYAFYIVTIGFGVVLIIWLIKNI
ncbi:UNVERIFIED_ORG: glucan phosphoethanolaminetransferase (alkaline phosphatase superfamily) [Leuconostoc holzapfelii]